ncbi:MAG: hypothetical protein MI741_18580, partial [Rhodospirillales bacterium]|nr:hypothetical protein [Rhodospirillales bacterium]
MLVSKFSYAKGRLDKVTDPDAIDTVFTYDDLGRRIKVEEADTRGVERHTLTQYDGLSNVTHQIADVGKDDTHSGGVWTTDADSQVTTYVFDDAYNASLPTQIIYPDSSSTATTGTDKIVLAYHLDGTLNTRTDQRGVVMTYTYDSLRRLELEAVTTLSTADGLVRAIGYSRDNLGRISKVTSYSDAAATTAINEVAYVYHDHGALKKVRMDHDSVVDNNTNIDTREIEYVYNETASGGEFTHGLRHSYTIYPNGRQVHTTYGTANGVDDLISRARGLADESTVTANTPGNDVVTYDYLGSGRLAVKDLPTPDLKLSYVASAGAASGGYTGYDRYGRLDTQHWVDEGPDPDIDLFKIAYGYDYASNTTYEHRQVYASYSKVHTHDDLHRLISTTVGEFDGTSAIKSHWQINKVGYTLDALGNKTSVENWDQATWSTDSFNDANEFSSTSGSHKTRADKGSAYGPLADFFASDSSANYTSIDDDSDNDDTFTISGGYLSFTALDDDNGVEVEGDGTTSDPRGVLVIGEDIGVAQLIVRGKFTTDAGYFGIVFGYKSKNDYWMYVRNAGDDELQLYHVVNGNRGSVLASSAETLTAGTWYFAPNYGERNAIQRAVFTLTDGYPSGKVGLVVSRTDIDIDYFIATSDDRVANTAGRLDNNASFRIVENYQSSDRLNLSGNWDGFYRPTLFKGVRAKRFEATFTLMATNLAADRKVQFVFNARDNDDYDVINLWLSASNPGRVPAGRIIDDGTADTYEGGTTDSSKVPPSMAVDTAYWVRITSDGTEVKVFMATSEAALNALGVNDQCFKSSNFDMTGGMLGFANGPYVYADDVTIKTDRDSNG